MKRKVIQYRPLSTPSVQGFTVFFAVWLISGLAAPAAYSRQPLWYPAFLEFVVVAGIPLTLSWVLRLKPSLIFEPKAFSWRNALLSCLVSLWLIFLLDEIEALQARVLPDARAVSSQAESLLKADSGVHLFFLLVSMALIPSLCEEFCFRGFLMDRFLQEGAKSRSVLITSVMFGFYHQDPKRFLTTGIAGLVLGYLVVRTGSLYPAVITHFGVNAGGILLVNSPLRNSLSWVEKEQRILLGLTLICLVGIFLTLKGLKKGRPCAWRSV